MEIFNISLSSDVHFFPFVQRQKSPFNPLYLIPNEKNKCIYTESKHRCRLFYSSLKSHRTKMCYYCAALHFLLIIHGHPHRCQMIISEVLIRVRHSMEHLIISQWRPYF